MLNLQQKPAVKVLIKMHILGVINTQVSNEIFLILDFEDTEYFIVILYVSDGGKETRIVNETVISTSAKGKCNLENSCF